MFSAAYAQAPVTALAALGVLLATAAAFALGRGKALAASEGDRRRLHSLPNYHGYYAAIWTGLPAFFILVGYIALGDLAADAILQATLPPDILSLPTERLQLFLNDARALAFGGTPSQDTATLDAAAERLLQIDALVKTGVAGLVAILAALGFLLSITRVRPEFRARNSVEGFVQGGLVVCSAIAILTTVGIVVSLVFEAARFFDMTRTIAPADEAAAAGEEGALAAAWVWVKSQLGAVRDFVFGLQWSPQIAIRADQVGQSGAFGAVPLFFGTLMITVIALLVAAPVGLYSAIYLSEYAGPRLRAIAKPMLEILAGIPTVVYGFFALLTVAPAVRQATVWIGESAPRIGWLNLQIGESQVHLLGWLAFLADTPAQSAVAAGVVMGIMIIPFVSSLSDDVINAVPQSLRDGSLAMGATKSETVRQVVMPAALPGVMGAVLLAVSRAVGETMIVVMAAGQAANITPNPFDSVTTVTVQIVSLLTGDTEFDSAKTLSAFALGLALFLVTLTMNVIALRIVQTYREKYD